MPAWPVPPASYTLALLQVTAPLACRFEKAETIKRDMKKAQALETAYKQGAAPEAAGREGSEGSDNEEDEDKIAEEKEAGVWALLCSAGVHGQLPVSQLPSGGSGRPGQVQPLTHQS